MSIKECDLEVILRDALLSWLYDGELSYESYVGICEQVDAIRLGYTDC